MHQRGFAFARAGDVQRVLRGLVFGQPIEHARHMEGDTRTHEDVAHSGEHGSVEGGQVGELHLFEVVDADRIGVAFAREKDFDKVGGDAELDQLAGIVGGVRRRVAIGCGRGFATGNEPGTQNALGHFRKGKGGEAAAHGASGVAILETADEDLIESGAGDDAELAEAGDGLSEPPAGDAGAHASLNDERVLEHACVNDFTSQWRAMSQKCNTAFSGGGG